MGVGGGSTANGQEGVFWDDQRVLKQECDDGCTHPQIYWKSFVYLQWVNLYNINYVSVKQWGEKQQGVGSRELHMNQDWQYVNHSCK